jgi:DNA-binding NarL/FixJ family response regulator
MLTGKGAAAMKRVFVLSSFPLFVHGVESMLRDEAGLEIVGRERHLEKGLQRIRDLRPDVVILDNGSEFTDPTATLMQIVREGGDIKVIAYSFDDNTMCVYCGEQRVVREVGDLMRAIQHNPFSDRPD